MRCLGGERRGVRGETERSGNIILQRVDSVVNSATFLYLYEYQVMHMCNSYTCKDLYDYNCVYFKCVHSEGPTGTVC